MAGIDACFKGFGEKPKNLAARGDAPRKLAYASSHWFWGRGSHGTLRPLVVDVG